MANSEKGFLAACVQMRSGVGRAANVQAATALIDEAAAAGAHFIATPEMTNVLDQDPKRLFSHLDPEQDAWEVEAFAALALRHKVWLLIGSMAVLAEDNRAANRRAANRSFLFAPDGTIAARYDKIHMFDVSLPDGETWRESKVYKPGESASLVEAPVAKIGLTICYDVRFPALYRALAQAGAEVFCVPAAFTKQTGEAHWATLLRARAIENGAFVIAPGQGGHHEDGRDTYGHSMIVGPWGEVLAASDSADPGVILARIDPEKAHKARAAIPNLALEPGYKVLNVKA